MLALLRVFLGVDNKLLPDSMTTDEFGKFIEAQKGKLFGNPEDFKALQQIISKKDVDFRKTKARLEELKSKKPKKDDDDEGEVSKLKKELGEKLDKVNKKLGKIDKANEVAKLVKDYPDILPELLIGKDEEQVKAVVEKQRAINKKLYGDSQKFVQPTYTDVDEVDKEIDAIKEDTSISGEKSAVKTLQLGRVKEGLESSPTE